MAQVSFVFDERSRTTWQEFYGFTEFRADGWPLCPQCGEDELYSLLNWNGQGDRPAMIEWIQAGLRCYRCGDCLTAQARAVAGRGLSE